MTHYRAKLTLEEIDTHIDAQGYTRERTACVVAAIDVTAAGQTETEQ